PVPGPRLRDRLAARRGALRGAPARRGRRLEPGELALDRREYAAALQPRAAGDATRGLRGALVERRQPVDRRGVPVDDVGAHAVLALLLEPRRPLRPLAGEVHQRDAVAAGVADPLDLHPHDGPDAAPGIGCRDHLAAAVEPDDPRGPLEGAEHHADPPVLAQVRGRLGAAADVVVVLDRSGAQDPEGLDRTLRRHVHVAAGGGGGAHEEEPLAADPRRELRVDAVVELPHGDTRTTAPVACTRKRRYAS